MVGIGGRISRMIGETTSLPALPDARAEWKNYLAFVKRPLLPERAAPIGTTGLLALGRMLVLDLAIMLVLVSAAIAALVVGVDLPETALAGLDIDLQLALMVVVMAPIGEEIVFRGWLSGRPSVIWSTAILLVGLLGMQWVVTHAQTFEQLDPIFWIAVLSVATAAAAIYLLRKRPPYRWFRAIFPLLFWLSTLGFASIHLLNYEEGSLAILLPLVLPQFLLGTILAYLRVNYGLWSCILLHAVHNGLILGIVALAAGFEA